MIINTNKINLLMANKCLTAGELSRLSGVSEVTLSRIRKGTQKPRPRTVGKIAQALGINVEALIEEEKGA